MGFVIDELFKAIHGVGDAFTEGRSRIDGTGGVERREGMKLLVHMYQGDEGRGRVV